MQRRTKQIRSPRTAKKIKALVAGQTLQNEATRTDVRPWLSSLRDRSHTACPGFMSTPEKMDQNSMLIQP